MRSDGGRNGECRGNSCQWRKNIKMEEERDETEHQDSQGGTEQRGS